jgi:hypothetical protein
MGRRPKEAGPCQQGKKGAVFATLFLPLNNEMLSLSPQKQIRRHNAMDDEQEPRCKDGIRIHFLEFVVLRHLRGDKFVESRGGAVIGWMATTRDPVDCATSHFTQPRLFLILDF